MGQEVTFNLKRQFLPLPTQVYFVRLEILLLVTSGSTKTILGEQRRRILVSVSLLFFPGEERQADPEYGLSNGKVTSGLGWIEVTVAGNVQDHLLRRWFLRGLGKPGGISVGQEVRAGES